MERLVLGTAQVNSTEGMETVSCYYICQVGDGKNLFFVEMVAHITLTFLLQTRLEH